MQKKTIVARGAIIVNHAPGSTVEVIIHENTLYVAAMDSDVFSETPTAKKSAEPTEGKVVKASSKSSEETKPAAKKKGKVFLSEEELSEMNPKALLQLLENLGEDPDDYNGKPSHQKNVDLAWSIEPEEGFDASVIPDESEEEEEETPKKKAVKKKADEEEEEEEEAEEEEEEEEEEEAPKKKGKELIKDFSDLEKGDEISALWSNLDETYTGKVLSSKNGTVSVKWEDGETESLDEEIHTKVYRLS